jgi:CDP-diacylglycerol--glycerol-3-phosphate 3-phosphatidyltransferase
MQPAFTWVLIPALLTDVADGLVARLFHLQSKLGAQLDSIGDALLLMVAAYGIWVFFPGIVRQHFAVVILLIGAWLLETLVALLRYGRLSSFHTYLSKIAGWLLGIFVGVLFLFGFQPWLMYTAVAVSIIGTLEELALVAALPQWRPDVRGLTWILRERRGGGHA